MIIMIVTMYHHLRDVGVITSQTPECLVVHIITKIMYISSLRRYVLCTYIYQICDLTEDLFRAASDLASDKIIFLCCVDQCHMRDPH